MNNLFRSCATGIALFSLAISSAAAQSWNSGYGQGMAIASIGSGKSAALTVVCPEGVIGDTNPYITLGFEPESSPRSGRAVIAFVIDGLTHAFNAEWNAQGSVEVRAGSGATRAQFEELLAALKNGNSVQAIVGDRDVRHDFSLTGSAKALQYVMSFCQ